MSIRAVQKLLIYLGYHATTNIFLVNNQYADERSQPPKAFFLAELKKDYISPYKTVSRIIPLAVRFLQK